MEIGSATSSTLARNGAWTRQDMMWVLGIYGNAVGGGSLFWPVGLGTSGFWTMLIPTLLAIPVTYIPYLALGRYVLSGTAREGRDGNILDTTGEHFGQRWAKVLTGIYFVTVFPPMAIYTIAITNTVIDSSKHQLHLGEPSRWIVAPVCIFFLLSLVRFKTATVVKLMGYIVAPFIISLVLFRLMAIPHWNMSMMTTAVEFGGPLGLMESVWNGLPLVVFAFSFTAITSSFVVAQRRTYGAQAEKKVPQIMLVAVIVSVSTLVFFSWSCIFALSPAELAEAKASNLTILSFLARKFDTPMIAVASQVIVFIAAIKSFMAHYLGTAESAKSFARSTFGWSEKYLQSKAFGRVIATAVFVMACTCAIANFDILNFVKVAIVPISVFVVYFFPLYAIHIIPAMKRYKGRVTTLLIAATGFVCLISGFTGIFAKFFH